MKADVLWYSSGHYPSPAAIVSDGGCGVRRGVRALATAAGETTVWMCVDVVVVLGDDAWVCVVPRDECAGRAVGWEEVH